MFDIKKPSFAKGALVFFETLLVLVLAVTIPFLSTDDTVKAFYGVSVESVLMEEGYGLYIDGVFIAACDDEKSVDEALTEVLQSAAEAYGNPHGEHSYVNEIEVTHGAYAKDLFIGKKALEMLLGKTEGGFTYKVNTAHGMKTDLSLTVSTVSKLEKEEGVKADVVVLKTDLLPVGESVLVDEGVDGVCLNEYSVTYVNGVQTENVFINSTLVTEPVDGEQWCGTDSGAALMSVGDKLMMPCGGYVTSWYGSRFLWGVQGFHNGLDFAGEGGSYGDPIYAAEDGIVSFSGWNGNYGQKIMVEHSKEITTLYAHCSKIIVEVGDVVRKGQVIGYIGNTGRVTGPHLHFEVFINGIKVNPKKHLDWSGYKWAEMKN